jgi:hypothetical protein
MEFNLRKMNNSYSQKYEILSKKINSTEVLILGSSQPFHGIDPSYLSIKSINLANVSQSFYYDKEVFFQATKRDTTIKYIVLSVSYFSYFYDLHNSTESWRDYYYRDFEYIKPNFELSRWDLKNYSYFALYTPIKSIRYFFENFKTDLTPNLLENGFQPIYNNLPNTRISEIEGYKRVQSHTKTLNLENLKLNIEYLEEILAYSNSRGIKVIFITPPVYKTYSKYCNDQLIKANILLTSKLCEKYDASYFDYFKDQRFNINDFFDNDHLNSTGSIKFSKIINKEILNKD